MRKLTVAERWLAQTSYDFRTNKEDIDNLIDKLLLAGEKQAEVRERFGLTWSSIDRRARALNLPRTRGVGYETFVERVRTAVLTELKPGEKFWPQDVARKKFNCGTGMLARVKQDLVKEGLIEKIDPYAHNRGFRRVQK